MPIEQAPVAINLREARKRGRDFFTLLWLFGWGVATAIALSALAITSQTETASQRLRSIFAAEPSAVAQMPPRLAHLEAESQVLAEQIRALNAERDRLAGRVALLESSIDDMTSTIKRQAASTAAALAAIKIAPPAPGAPAAGPSAPTNTPTVNAAVPAPSVPPVAAVSAETKADPVTTSSVPLPPGRNPPSQTAVEADAPAANSSEFGLDLGGAATLDGVRQRWTTVKANFGPILAGMHPLAAPDRRQGKPGYRLVVGPLPNSPAAGAICAHFNAAHTACRPSKYEGEQILQR
ncbi:MAG TPA: hypothetical protein VFB29_04755 [Pseudolabrys sp.]|nr:hypothetical protein [Pseudolabrys sp.]